MIRPFILPICIPIDLTTHVTQNQGVTKTGKTRNYAIGERRASNPQHSRKPPHTYG
jgi:hypothetical protein